jgi:hypothetical protein
MVTLAQGWHCPAKSSACCCILTESWAPVVIRHPGSARSAVLRLPLGVRLTFPPATLYLGAKGHCQLWDI